jgi:hypothetical protein
LPSAQEGFEGLLRRYIRAGKREASGLGIGISISRLYRELLDPDLSAWTIRYAHAILRLALKWAVQWKLFA